MNYQEAYDLLIARGTALQNSGKDENLLQRLKQGKPPLPGEVTSILLALKIVFEELPNQNTLDRNLVLALHLLAFESQRLFEAGRSAGVSWPPLLKEDLQRIAASVASIFADEWRV
ncbi:MAG TPA: Dethiobiotin synthetase [Oscillatoriaceae cyanobacterium M33_DOE_052]|uniref:Dethiobiotin synthetase n=1 Tax=Planktothricoides sp. SpSt-374 TaxID=2282167 RepID=A0A7C3VP96_9CYAN|nr:Dethiobiotin synthetase [Oscillatoriaceae cyanobacterium M33_DOE_052]